MTIAIKPTASGSTIEQDGSTILTVDGSGNITPSNDLYPKSPAVFAYLSADQSVSSSVWTKVAFDIERFDTNNFYDNTTNYRFQPTIAGYYQINTNVFLGGASGTVAQVTGIIYKNGGRYAWFGYGEAANNNEGVITGSTLAYLNGSTDYIEIYALLGATSPVFKGGNTSTNDSYSTFSAHLVSV